jgi:hypothetical protein
MNIQNKTFSIVVSSYLFRVYLLCCFFYQLYGASNKLDNSSFFSFRNSPLFVCSGISFVGLLLPIVMKRSQYPMPQSSLSTIATPIIFLAPLAWQSHNNGSTKQRSFLQKYLAPCLSLGASVLIAYMKNKDEYGFFADNYCQLLASQTLASSILSHFLNARRDHSPMVLPDSDTTKFIILPSVPLSGEEKNNNIKIFGDIFNSVLPLFQEFCGNDEKNPFIKVLEKTNRDDAKKFFSEEYTNLSNYMKACSKQNNEKLDNEIKIFICLMMCDYFGDGRFDDNDIYYTSWMYSIDNNIKYVIKNRSVYCAKYNIVVKKIQSFFMQTRIEEVRSQETLLKFIRDLLSEINTVLEQKTDLAREISEPQSYITTPARNLTGAVITKGKIELAKKNSSIINDEKTEQRQKKEICTDIEETDSCSPATFSVIQLIPEEQRRNKEEAVKQQQEERLKQQEERLELEKTVEEEREALRLKQEEAEEQRRQVEQRRQEEEEQRRQEEEQRRQEERLELEKTVEQEREAENTAVIFKGVNKAGSLSPECLSFIEKNKSTIDDYNVKNIEGNNLKEIAFLIILHTEQAYFNNESVQEFSDLKINSTSELFGFLGDFGFNIDTMEDLEGKIKEIGAMNRN